ncbi:MAG: stage III sporulation protein AD [Clostridiaceae bacterium]|jgi:stage III sporulation protein AD|nr:stage III sporulation protein AD [Clostridiaceae bacterium]
MEIIQIVMFSIITTIIIVMLKAHRPEIAVQASLAAGVIIFALIIAKLSPIFDFIKIYTGKANINTQYLPVLIKIIGIAYITEFGAEVCRDAGENSIATKVEMAGKVLITILAVPIITTLLELIVKIMP